MPKKQAILSYNRPTDSWIIRTWSEQKQEWVESCRYYVKDINPETEYGFVSEELIADLYSIKDKGYEVIFQ